MRIYISIACLLLSLPSTLRAAEQSLIGPFTHDNLTIFLISGPDQSNGRTYLTLQEALDQKKVVVHETGNVNELSVENVSNDPVFIQAGEIVKGGQQDRTLGTDMILTKAMGNTPISSFCVEHGRWTGRGGEQADRFASSDTMVAGKMKVAANANSSVHDQGLVWASVVEQQTKLTDNLKSDVRATNSPSSFQLTLESAPLVDKSAEYEKALSRSLEDQHDVVGWAYAINGKVAGANVYASPELFKKLWPKLLKSACVEAIAELPTNGPTTQPTVAQKDVTGFMDDASQPAAEAKQVNGRTRIVNHEQEKLEMIQSEDTDGTWVHRNYLTKDPKATPQRQMDRLNFNGPQINAPAQQPPNVDHW
jgi:hypothetical protein